MITAIIGGLITIVIAFIGSWIQLNGRISVLEVQVNETRNLITKYDRDMSDVKDMLTEIKISLEHLKDTKADKDK